MKPEDRQRTGVLVALLAVSVAGIADVGEFVATRPGMFTTAPGRAAGSVLGLAIWAALGAATAGRLTGSNGAGARWATVSLAGIAAAGSLGLLAIHVKAGVGGFRPIALAVLGVAAFGLALASVSGSALETPATGSPGPAPS